MVDFSSVNLRILSPDGKTVLAELQTLDRVNQQTGRRISATQSAAMGQISRQAAVSTRQIAGNISMIAAAGEATASSLKGIVSQGANIAFMFGTGGAIAGAVGVTALAIFNLFSRTRKEIEETTNKALTELGRLTEGANIGAVGGRFGVATKMFSGDPFAVRGEDEDERAFQARQRGILGVRAEIARLQSIIDRNMGGGALQQSARQNALNSMREWQRELSKLEPRYERLIALMRELEETEGRAAANAMAAARGKSDDKGTNLLDDLLDKRKMPETSALGLEMLFLSPRVIQEQLIQSVRDGLKKMPPLPPREFLPELEEVLRLDAVAASIGASFGSALISGLTDGISAALSGGRLGGAFEAMTGAVFVGLGHMAIQIGTESAAFLTLMQTLKDAIASFMPGVGLGAAFAMIGLGAAMVALGGSMGGGGRIGGGRTSGGFGGGSFGGGGSTIIDRGLINPLNGVVAAPGRIVPRESITNHFTIIGENDPRAQRAIVTMVDKGRARRGG